MIFMNVFYGFFYIGGNEWTLIYGTKNIFL